MYYYIYETKIGSLAITTENDKITSIFLFKNTTSLEKYEKKETLLIKKAHKQLLEYLDGKRKNFDLPLDAKGTEFQTKVWAELEKIPYGETRSYKDIAVAIGNVKAVRAIGMANNKNPIIIVVPCHRVIGSDKSLVGYGGGLELKKFLLDLEKNNFSYVEDELLSLAEEKHKNFNKKLIPSVDNILGVKMPKLRKLAKKIADEDWRDFYDNYKEDYFEEVILKALILEYAVLDVDEALLYVEKYIDKITNWSICDTFCTCLKFTKENKAKVWSFIKKYANSKDQYEARFFSVMYTYYFIDEEYFNKYIKAIKLNKHRDYYSQMAIAWALSMSYIEFPEKTLKFLEENKNYEFIYNKSLRKIIESNQVSFDEKKKIKNLL